MPRRSAQFDRDSKETILYVALVELQRDLWQRLERQDEVLLAIEAEVWRIAEAINGLVAAPKAGDGDAPDGGIDGSPVPMLPEHP